MLRALSVGAVTFLYVMLLAYILEGHAAEPSAEDKCFAEFEKVTVAIDRTHVPKEHSHISTQTLFVRQCVAKKQLLGT